MSFPERLPQMQQTPSGLFVNQDLEGNLMTVREYSSSEVLQSQILVARISMLSAKLHFKTGNPIDGVGELHRGTGGYHLKTPLGWPIEISLASIGEDMTEGADFLLQANRQVRGIGKIIHDPNIFKLHVIKSTFRVPIILKAGQQTE